MSYDAVWQLAEAIPAAMDELLQAARRERRRTAKRPAAKKSTGSRTRKSGDPKAPGRR
jgi:hypothetical protein